MRYYGKIHSKLPIFCVKSVKIYTAQKNLHEYIRGVRDKYQVWNNWPSQSFAYLTLGLVAKDFQRLLEPSGVTDSLRAVASLLQRLWCGGPQTFVVRPKLGFCVFRIYVEPIEKK